jgi:THO complex subunit 5
MHLLNAVSSSTLKRSTMSANALISDADLQSVLTAAEDTRRQCSTLLTLLDSNPVPSSGAYSDDVQAELTTQQKLVHAHLAAVRTKYRTVQTSVRHTKASTLNSRADVDALHLRLQNLYYERAHVSGEIASCESYSHKYTSLPMIPLSEFLALRPEFESQSEDEVMVARIEHEHEERKALEEKRQGLLKRKVALMTENNKRREDLANLDKDLEKFIEAAQPIVKTFEGKYGGEVVMKG